MAKKGTVQFSNRLNWNLHRYCCWYFTRQYLALNDGQTLLGRLIFVDDFSRQKN